MLGGAQQEDLLLPEPREVAQLLAMLACNAHTVCDEELRPLGAGLYPLGALLNHSSTPSCMQGFVGSDITFRWAAVHPGWECWALAMV